MTQGPRHFIEKFGWLLIIAIPVAVIVLSKNNAPVLLQNILVGLGFLIAFPLMWITLKRQWRQLRGEDETP